LRIEFPVININKGWREPEHREIFIEYLLDEVADS
jgi:hypothetical protein